MDVLLIAVVDRHHARLFTFEESDFPEQTPSKLIQRVQILNEIADQTAATL